MNILLWRIRISKKQPKKRQPLPEHYDAAKKSGKLVVLPGEKLTPAEYLTDLVSQLKNDIYPLFRKTNGAAPFTTTRNVLCFVDHISQLQYGIQGRQTPRMKNVINSLGFTDQSLNSRYKKYSPYILQIYRHDLVHNIRPFPKQIKIKTTGGSQVGESWFMMRTIIDGLSFEDNLTHMKKKSSRKNRAHLRLDGNQVNVDTVSLFYDVVIYIEQLIEKINANPKLGRSITNNYYEILHAHYFDIKNVEIDQTTEKQIVE